MQLDKDLQSVQEVRDLIKTAKEAQRALARMDQGQIDKIVAAISAAGAEHAGRLAAMAVEETGFGKKEDKELKNRFAALTLYEAIKNERTMAFWPRTRRSALSTSACRWASWPGWCPPPTPPPPSSTRL